MSGDNPKTWAQRFFSFCLLVLGGVISLWLAVELVAQFWGWLLLVGALIAVTGVAIMVLRARRNRW